MGGRPAAGRATAGNRQSSGRQAAPGRATAGSRMDGNRHSRRRSWIEFNDLDNYGMTNRIQNKKDVHTFITRRYFTINVISGIKKRAA